MYEILPVYFDLENNNLDRLKDALNLHGEKGYSVATTTYIANGCILVLMQRHNKAIQAEHQTSAINQILKGDQEMGLYLTCLELDCNWSGEPDELVSKTEDIDDDNYSFCPSCGNENFDEEEMDEEDV